MKKNIHTHLCRNLLSLTICILLNPYLVSAQGTSYSQTKGTPSPWSFSFLSITSVSRPSDFEVQKKAYYKNDVKLFNYSYLGLNYSINGLERVSIGTQFLSMSISHEEIKYLPLDLFISYKQSKLISFDSVVISRGGRLYLPTSRSSFDSKMLFGVRTELAVKMKIDAWKWGYFFKPDFYFYEKNEYADSTKRNQIVPSKMITLEHYLEAERAINRFFGIRPNIGFVDTWFNSASQKTGSNHNTELVVRLGLDLNIPRKFNLGLGLGLENKTSVTFREKPWIPLGSEDNSLFLVAYAEI